MEKFSVVVQPFLKKLETNTEALALKSSTKALEK